MRKELIKLAGPLKGLAKKIREAGTKYRIMCNVWFIAQDGPDYMTHEADGKLYDTKKEAELIKKYYEGDSWKHNGKIDYFIEEVEM